MSDTLSDADKTLIEREPDISLILWRLSKGKETILQPGDLRGIEGALARLLHAVRAEADIVDIDAEDARACSAEALAEAAGAEASAKLKLRRDSLEAIVGTAVENVLRVVDEAIGEQCPAPAPAPAEAARGVEREALIAAFEPMCAGFGHGNMPRAIATDFANAALSALSAKAQDAIDGLSDEAFAIINDLMEMMDWVGTGSSAEGDKNRKEYEARIAALKKAQANG